MPIVLSKSLTRRLHAANRHPALTNLLQPFQQKTLVVQAGFGGSLLSLKDKGMRMLWVDDLEKYTVFSLAALKVHNVTLVSHIVAFSPAASKVNTVLSIPQIVALLLQRRNQARGCETAFCMRELLQLCRCIRPSCAGRAGRVPAGREGGPGCDNVFWIFRKAQKKCEAAGHGCAVCCQIRVDLAGMKLKKDGAVEA
eukprot:1137076-Pelagomonas_calceolata.AAC.2